MLDAALKHRLEEMLSCDCTASPLSPETTHQALALLLEELEKASPYPE